MVEFERREKGTGGKVRESGCAALIPVGDCAQQGRLGVCGGRWAVARWAQGTGQAPGGGHGWVGARGSGWPRHLILTDH